ncbi:MAG: hypothetical protein ACR2KL_01300 [Nocardioidaceae bacterium]
MPIGSSSTRRRRQPRRARATVLQRAGPRGERRVGDGGGVILAVGGDLRCIAVVALNLFTNYFNHVVQTELDLPPAPAL